MSSIGSIEPMTCRLFQLSNIAFEIADDAPAMFAGSLADPEIIRFFPPAAKLSALYGTRNPTSSVSKVMRSDGRSLAASK